MKRGKIIKVSGPLVVADGMADARMYDVVRVSEKRLIGEIVELRGDRASIQVYEETGGLGVGEPVFTTGQPLSVELAPGLIGGIYDGIQRPLDIIRDKVGDHITRGVDIPAIDRKKKWRFKPSVKKGAEVVPGDILGTVQETPVVVHKVMVPYGVQGRVVEIRGGTFTVEDAVAKVKTESGIEEIRMLKRWPVRKERPYKEKLSPAAPLITGQRVIDSFFPVAKGGTACIPGPFGSGKCVSGETPAMMGNGKILPIKEIFEDGKKRGSLIKIDEFEEIYNVVGLKNPTVISLSGERFETREPISLYKGLTNGTICLKTRTGKRVEVTPAHKLFVLDDDRISQRESKEIKVGDFLAAPRRISLKLQNYLIDPLEIFADSNLLSCDEIVNETARQHLRRLFKEKRLEERARQYLRKTRKIPVKILRQIASLTEVDLSAKEVCAIHGKRVVIPREVNPAFSEFLGYVIADGNLKRSSYSVRFYNSSRAILSRFLSLSKVLFGVVPYVYRHPKGSTFIAQIDCKVIYELLERLGTPSIQKAKKATIPEYVLRSSDECIAAFVSAYIACDGTIDVDGSRLEISTASKRMMEQLSFVLLRLGVISSLGKPRKDGTFRISVSSSSQLEQISTHLKIPGKKGELLQKAIKPSRWTSIDAIPVPETFKELFKKPGILSYLQERGIYASTYLSREQKIGVEMLINIIKILSGVVKIPASLARFLKILKEVFFDEVVEVERINEAKVVYDVEVPVSHNFVGGHGPLLLHNTVAQHQFAKWSDADIIIYVACGERGNETADVLLSFPELIDPRSGEKLIKRTIMIANTSNMPVAAREASIYTGITIAEYFRDMGYSVALMADSTSRWAEALREMSGRLEEMPGEEGYPAYLPTRVAEFYERAGRVVCLGSDNREGTLSVLGAISPPGGDLADPVVQGTLKVVQVFWSLEDWLACERHFPAINWLTSYSLYLDNLDEYFRREVSEDWPRIRQEAMKLLQEEAELKEIARLVGIDALSPQERLILETAKSIREDFLHQNAFHEVDTYTSFSKQFRMLKAIMFFHSSCLEALERGVLLQDLSSLRVREEIARAKYIDETKLESFDELEAKIGAQIGDLGQSKAANAWER